MRVRLIAAALLLTLGTASACPPSKADLTQAPVGVSILGGKEFRDTAALKRLGARAVRAEIHWSLVEAIPGRYDWARIDELFADTDALGLDVLAIITAPPDHIWRNTDENFAAAAARFATAVAQRYAKRAPKPLRAIEVFNEPNLAGYGWTPRGADPRAYARRYALTLVRVGDALRRVDASIVIVSGGLSPDGMPPLEFIDVLAANGAWSCFDAFGGHPYGRTECLPQVTRDVEQAFADRRLPKKPIWFTELGDTDTSRCPQSLTAAWRGRAKNQALFWFTLRDFGGFWQPSYGLYTKRWRIRPCGEAFAKLQAER